MKKGLTNRWLILMAGLVCNLCLSGFYIWSVFQNPLIGAFKSNPSAVSLAYSLQMIVMSTTSIIAGRIQDKYGPRYLVLAGSVLWGAGWFLTGFSQSVAQVYLFFGVIAGLGSGCVYNCCISNTVKWFQDKKGLATGLIVGAAGFGPVVLSPLAYFVMAKYGVFMTFEILGGGFMLVMVLVGWLIVAPPVGWNSSVINTTSSDCTGKGNDKNWKEMMSDPLFYVLWLMLMCGATSGVMMIGHASSIGQEVAKLTGAVAAMVVSILAISNTAGRIFWGYFSDKFGLYKILMIIFVITAVGMVTLGQTGSFFPFITVICVIGLCYGGVLAIFPSVCADLFGLKHHGQNYGILFTGFAGGAFIGPRLAAKCKEINGNYTLSFIIAAILAACAIVLIAVIMQQRKKRLCTPANIQTSQ